MRLGFYFLALDFCLSIAYRTLYLFIRTQNLPCSQTAHPIVLLSLTVQLCL